MSNFVVSARKYRPTRFMDVVGQEHVSTTLKNALQNDHLAHAFLFCGPRGVGKTTCARILAKVLNCQNLTPDHEPCNVCESCKAFNENASFNITELDAASNNSVEHIRALIEQVRFQPQQGKYKIFIIDEVHMLSQQAFNAFLKTLEEPPSYAIFILATTEKHKIIPTILSRCQIFDFKRIQVGAMISHLQKICEEEGIVAEKDALHIIAQKADGALRDSLSIFDRIVSFSGKNIRYEDVISNLNVLDYDYYFKMVDAMLLQDVAQVLNIFDGVLNKGFDADIFINGLAGHLRDLLVGKDPQTLQLLEVSDGVRERYIQQAQLIPRAVVLTAMNIANDCDINYKMARNKRLHVEMALLKMAHIQQAVAIANGNGNGVVVEKKKPELKAPPAAPTTKPAPQSTPPAAKAPAAPTPNLSEKKKKTLGGAALKLQTPKLKDLSAIVAEVKQGEAQNGTAEEAKEVDMEELQKAWQIYINNCKKESIKSILRNTQISFEGQTIIITVGSSLAENTIRQESAMMEYLRKSLKMPNLAMQINVDRSKVPEAPKIKKPLTNMEKFMKMHEVNPLVREVQQRFGLKFDEDA